LFYRECSLEDLNSDPQNHRRREGTEEDSQASREKIESAEGRRQESRRRKKSARKKSR
jgi:hypothetical protein